MDRIRLLSPRFALIAVMVMRFRGETPLAAKSWRPHFYRGGLYVIGSFAFVFALRYLPFAEVVAIAFAGPMFMTLFGRFFLGESVGWHRLSAVLIGFVGVPFVIRPGTDAMHWAVVLPLIVALADAARDLVTRKMAGGESIMRRFFHRLSARTGRIYHGCRRVAGTASRRSCLVRHQRLRLRCRALFNGAGISSRAAGRRRAVSPGADRLDDSGRCRVLERSPDASRLHRHRYHLRVGHLHRLGRSNSWQGQSQGARNPDNFKRRFSLPFPGSVDHFVDWHGRYLRRRRFRARVAAQARTPGIGVGWKSDRPGTWRRARLPR